MKLFLVTRGSQGDVYPYLALASELKKRGHEVTLSLPQLFENLAKSFQIRYVLQACDDVRGMIGGAAETNQKTSHLLKWVRRVMDKQFEEFIPVLNEHDILIAANTEFAAPSIAEYCKKPVIRTAFAPFLPGTLIPPPVMPWPKANPVFTPRFLWKALNTGTNFMVLHTLNKNRKQRGMPPVKNFGLHAAETSANFLMYSRYLGNTDPGWTYKWDIGGYCFNDALPHDEDTFKQIMAFIRENDKPALFFTLGSCDAKDKDRISEWLLDICIRRGYKLVVGSGWFNTGSRLQNNPNVFIADKPVRHSLIFPCCKAIIHHGGCGATHSAARAGKPQLVFPLIIDQHYWGNRVSELGVGPERARIARISAKQLEDKVNDLVNNASYQEKAAALGKQIQSEQGVEDMCHYIEATFG
ncbi:MAG: glycosyltransferase [Tannerellaceae bacterium]|jgi:UDP:flavonoid glycosyltransferase YjiC (YdhE family)|nr:glycosyltransferase [Tannerellaceae bacterium]